MKVVGCIIVRLREGKIEILVKTSSTAGQAMTTTATTLNNYNNDLLTPTCTAYLPTGPATP